MAEQTTFRQRVQRRKRILRWWERHCIQIVVFVIIAFGFMLGWFCRGLFSTQKAKAYEPEHTCVVQETVFVIQEEKPMEVFYYDVPLDEDIQDYIRELASEEDLPMELILAIIGTESNYDPSAVSKSGDYGLMQINAINHEWLREDYGITDIMDPYQNIKGGVTILSKYRSLFDTLEETVIAYNRGPTGARRLFAEGVESTEYSEMVMTRYEQLKREAALEAGTPEDGMEN